MHPLFARAGQLSSQVIGAAIEVHRHKGPGLTEFIYEKYLSRELFLRGIDNVGQKVLPIEYKGQLLSYMKLLDIPISLRFNFHETKLVDGMARLILPRADAEGSGGNEGAFRS